MEHSRFGYNMCANMESTNMAVAMMVLLLLLLLLLILLLRLLLLVCTSCFCLHSASRLTIPCSADPKRQPVHPSPPIPGVSVNPYAFS